MCSSRPARLQQLPGRPQWLTWPGRAIQQATALMLATFASALPAQTQTEPQPMPPPSGEPSFADQANGLFTEAFFLKLGFSFMAGLAMGFALKFAFRIALLIIGIVLFAVFGLQYLGIVDINWPGLESHYDSWITTLRHGLGAFLGYAAENLSSAVSFFAGLALALKRW